MSARDARNHLKPIWERVQHSECSSAVQPISCGLPTSRYCFSLAVLAELLNTKAGNLQLRFSDARKCFFNISLIHLKETVDAVSESLLRVSVLFGRFCKANA